MYGQTGPKIPYSSGTFLPTVTLVGGSGNVVPVYSTNIARFTQFGNQRFVDIYLTGDGGAEGAGTGGININLEVAPATNHPQGYFPCGTIINNAEKIPVYGQLVAGDPTIGLFMQSDTAGAMMTDFVLVTGADQNNTTRSIRLKFFYEV